MLVLTSFSSFTSGFVLSIISSRLSISERNPFILTWYMDNASVFGFLLLRRVLFRSCPRFYAATRSTLTNISADFLKMHCSLINVFYNPNTVSMKKLFHRESNNHAKTFFMNNLVYYKNIEVLYIDRKFESFFAIFNLPYVRQILRQMLKHLSDQGVQCVINMP